MRNWDSLVLRASLSLVLSLSVSLCLSLSLSHTHTHPPHNTRTHYIPTRARVPHIWLKFVLGHKWQFQCRSVQQSVVSEEGREVCGGKGRGVVVTDILAPVINTSRPHDCQPSVPSPACNLGLQSRFHPLSFPVNLPPFWGIVASLPPVCPSLLVL